MVRRWTFRQIQSKARSWWKLCRHFSDWRYLSKCRQSRGRHDVTEYSSSKTTEHMTIDVKSAFLVADLSDSPAELTFIRIEPTCSAELVGMFPFLDKYRDAKGMLTMRCNESIYGLPCAAHKFESHLNGTMRKIRIRSV